MQSLLRKRISKLVPRYRVDADARRTRVSHYVQKETGLTPAYIEVCVIGDTLDGTVIEGCDTVRVLGR